MNQQTEEAFARAITEMQADMKRSIISLALSLHASGHLDAKDLEGRLEKELARIEPRNNQNAGILLSLLFATTGITGNFQLHGQYAPPTVVLTK